MAIQYTPGVQLPYPERTDTPKIATRDLRDLALKTDSVLVQTKAEAAEALGTAQDAETTAGQAMTAVQRIEDPVYVGPEPPTAGQDLWVDTNQEPTPMPVALVKTPHPTIEGLYLLDAAATAPPAPSRGVGYVGQYADLSPYTALTATGVDDPGEVVSWDLVHAGGGKTLRTRLQGRWDGTTAQMDALQRVEEVTTGSGYLIGPRSNWEVAYQLYQTTTSTTGAQFVPYHGVATAFEREAPVYTTLPGVPVTMPGIGATITLADGLVVRQSLYGRHPSAGVNQTRLDMETRFHPDGLVEVQGTWTALVDVKVGSVYAPMVPYAQADIDQLEHAGGTITLDTTAPTAITSYDIPSTIDTGVLKSTARPGVRIAWAWTSPNATLRRTAGDRKITGTVAFIQRRTDGINKVYFHVWNPGTIVQAGESWEFGGQWRYLEVTS